MKKLLFLILLFSISSCEDRIITSQEFEEDPYSVIAIEPWLRSKTKCIYTLKRIDKKIGGVYDQVDIIQDCNSFDIGDKVKFTPVKIN